MQEAADKLVGLQDFRNFCRMDPKVTNFVREIYSLKVIVCEENESVEDYYQLCRFEVFTCIS